MAPIQSVSGDGLVVCVCGERKYTARDVIDAALFRGTLQPRWAEFLCRSSAEKRAKDLQLELDYVAIEDMAEAFRYAHDLITAEETEQWLSARGRTLEEFSDYFARQYWHTELREKISRVDVDLFSAAAELRQLFTIDLIFSDELGRLSRQLTWRLAALAATGRDRIDPKEIGREREQFLERHKIKASKIAAWLSSIDRDEEWLDEILAMETAYRKTCERVVNAHAQKKQLSMLQLPLTRFEAEVIEVESRDAAKEALMCIQQDGMSMEQVAAEARYPFRRIAFHQQDIPDDLQQKFWAVQPGDLLEPVPRGDGFELYRIIKKAEPELDDAAVRQKIDNRLLEQHFSALAREHVELRLPEVIATE